MPELEYLPVEGLSASLNNERWKLETTWPKPEPRTGGFQVVIKSLVDTQTGGHGILWRNINWTLSSVSGRDGIARKINVKSHPEDRRSLEQFLDAAAYTLSRGLEAGRRANFIDTAGAKPPPMHWLLHPFWPATGSVGLAAAPSSLKSFLALGAGLQIATGYQVLQGDTITTRDRGDVLYIDWEDTDEMFTRRLRAIENGAGIPHGKHLAYYRPARTLEGSIDAIVDATLAIKPRAVIIDSMSAAIDGSMNDSDVVNAFWSAVHALRVPCLVITHKSLENQKKRKAAFMGSGMSLARVRMAWNAEKNDTGQVVWTCFKDNHGDNAGTKLAWNVDFHNTGEWGEVLESVQIEALPPNQIHLASEAASQATRQAHVALIEWLEGKGEEGATVAEAEKMLGQSYKTASNRLSELVTEGELVKQKEQGRNRYWLPIYKQRLVDAGEQPPIPTDDDLPDPM